MLAIGAALGLALAAVGVLRELPGSTALPPGAIARVEGALIQRDDFLRLVAGYESDTRQPTDAKTRRHILDRMIEEELLIARALALGLGHLDRKVRADLTSGLIASIVSEYDGSEPTEAERQAHYDENRGYFAIPGRLRIRQMRFSAGASAAGAKGNPEVRANLALERLREGEDWELVRHALATPDIFPLPDAMLPAQKLREYVGPTVVRESFALAPGEMSEVIRSGGGFRVIELLDREPLRTPALADIRDQVASDWRRRQGDNALRRYIDDLREDAEILIALDPIEE